MARLVDAFAECLDVLRKGGDVEEALARYAEHKEEIMLLLEVVGKIEPLPPLEPDTLPDVPRKKLPQLDHKRKSRDIESKE